MYRNFLAVIEKSNRRFFKKGYSSLLILVLVLCCFNFIGCAKDEWIITQYPDASGSQGMFYTIRNKAQNKLIVIDSGNPLNEETVRMALKENGNHVDAWFLTHYHPDHVGALNDMLPNMGKINVDKFYVSPIDYEKYLSVAQAWDGPEMYTIFRDLTKQMTNIVFCNRDDKITVGDLSIDVLNTYDDLFVEKNIGDIPNNGCLILKFNFKNTSMLFMGDAHSQDIVSLITERYGEKLQADYIQLGHHGNNTTDYSFYDIVKPKVAFFDAPEWLMVGEQYRAKGLETYLKNKGITCYDFSSGKNIIKIN